MSGKRKLRFHYENKSTTIVFGLSIAMHVSETITTTTMTMTARAAIRNYCCFL